MGKKVYAIKEGFNFETNEKVENKIVSTWSECLKYVKGVKGAKYKSFPDIESASEYLSEDTKLLRKEDNNYPKDCLHVYVDGSYNISTEEYSYGLVAVRNNVVEYINSSSAKDSSKKNIRQIAGELEAAVKAVQYAIEKGDKCVVIFHDYEGICHHATGFWERKEQSSVEYYEKMNKLMSQGIQVIFVKVDSHTGDFFNELVDEKCKEKLLIASDRVVEKWLLTNCVNVSDERVKQEILNIAPKGEKNIIIINPNEKKVENKTKENQFSIIISEYDKDPEYAKSLIYSLSSKEKNDFIVYLLEKNN
ncbi:ribonuclease H family protein [Clostridium scatologenes]|uniref:Ribonuclease HI n=1 Tax=Clostridium scatologenes TaxID=1548 RepID=A0A0E3M7V6_CLOSL|nr:ribonuclease H family protein [Clostridium scatologenes]AKA70822.1 ribonuclease HI [Clostridium scatologenes]